MTAGGVLRAEWTKFVTIRSTTVLTGAIVAVSVLLGWLFGTAGAGQYAEATAQERLDFDPLANGTRGLLIVQLLVAGLGALVASSEYGSGTMRASVAAVGRRGRLLAAKGLLTVLAALVASAVAIPLMLVVSQGTLAAHGAPRLGLGDPGVTALLLVGPVVFALIALFGLALGLLLRGTAAAVNVSTTFLLLPIFGGTAAGWVREVLSTYWPNMAGFHAASAAAGPDLPPVAGLGILVGFVAIMLAGAFVRFTSSDV